MAEWSTLELTVEGSLAYLRFARPERNNAVTALMVTEMYEALLELSASVDVHVVVLTGSGRHFCPGADLRTDRTDPLALPDPVSYQSARLLHEMPQVTVAAVNGGCAGPGLAWAAACDLRFAAERARFSTAFLEVGLASELGLPWTLERIVGAGVARDLCFLPGKFTAAEALAMGLVSRVFPDESFERDARQLVAEMAGRRPEALRALKANFVDAGRMSLADFIAVETDRHQQAFRDRKGDAADS